MQKIIIIGSSCVGKTTLARQISDILDIPHIELDQLYWKPNWIEQDTKTFRKLVTQATDQHSAWVMDGNYAVIRDITWPQASTIIWLNYSFSRVLYQAISRTIKRGLTGEKICNGNQEKMLRSLFSKDSIIWWVITTFHDKRRRYHQIFKNLKSDDIELLTFSTHKETAHFTKAMLKQETTEKLI